MKNTRTIRVVLDDHEKVSLMRLIKIHGFKRISDYARYKLFSYEENLEKIKYLYSMINKNADES